MGAGRSKKGDPINMAVGIVMKGKVGSKLNGGDAVATIYGDTEEHLKQAEEILHRAISYSDQPVKVPPVIKARVSKNSPVSVGG
jgi:pyrimidine-nucleoside phosphorylase